MIHNLYHNSYSSSEKSDLILPILPEFNNSEQEMNMNQREPSREYFSIEIEDEESKSINIAQDALSH